MPIIPNLTKDQEMELTEYAEHAHEIAIAQKECSPFRWFVREVWKSAYNKEEKVFLMNLVIYNNDFFLD